LRAFYAEHDEANPCTLSVPELAARFVPNAKACNGERAVLRAHQRIRATHRGQFHETRQRYGRATLAYARWWSKDPGGSGRSVVVGLGEVDLRTGDLDQQAMADRARAPDSAFRSTPRSQHRNERAREAGGSPRRRAVPHGVVNPPELAPLPVKVAEGGLEAVRARWPEWSDALAKELRRQRYHDNPGEACRAVRTLAQRDTDTPLRLLRDLFNRARGGDLLVDKAAEAELVEAVEAAARRVYAYDEHDPSTHWVGPPHEPTPDELAAEREAQRWREVRRAREAELRKERAAGVGWWHVLASIARTAVFLGNLKPETAADVVPKSNATL
jgi:hypothetical protein